MSLAEQDDALIRAALEGSARAWDQLVRCHETQVYNFSLRLTGNPTDALDLMQEVFLGVYRNLHRFRGDSQFSTWLFRIAHNKAIDMGRRRPSSTSLESALEDAGDLIEARWQQLDDVPEQDPQALLDERQRNAWIMAQMGALPLEQRLVVELKVFQSLTFEEIAELQDISANTAKTRFYTALRRLKALMENDHGM
jgi:RNA polymerase sigma-70 factor (ECF subfamily)